MNEVIMGKREAQYSLSAQVELDVSYFQTSVITNPESEDIEKETKMVQTPVLVIAESKPVDEILREYLTNITENKYVNKASKLLRRSSTQKVKKVVRYIKMFAMPDSKYASIALRHSPVTICTHGRTLVTTSCTSPSVSL